MEILMSDLHMSSPLFKREKEVIELYNDPKVESVYILGDLFDTWEECLKRTLRRHAALIDVINNSGKTEVILKGNHDPDEDTLKGIFDKVYVTDTYVTEFFGKETIMVHGDEFDGNELAGKILFYLMQWPLGRVGFNGKAILRNLIYKSVLWRKKAEYNDLILKMEKGLVEKYRNDFDIIIAGHTHITKMARDGKTTFVNTGTMLHNPSYIIAENNTMRIKRL
jgi:UDP-2,3-diacylglucosamine pyrophosphatase LpxH